MDRQIDGWMDRQIDRKDRLGQIRLDKIRLDLDQIQIYMRLDQIRSDQIRLDLDQIQSRLDQIDRQIAPSCNIH